MSVGHAARVFEGAGISTVCIYIRAFRHQAQALKPPRTLVTPHLLGRTVGSPGDIMRQRSVTRAALRLLETASEPSTVEEFAPALR